jgi:hypothetical protein
MQADTKRAGNIYSSFLDCTRHNCSKILGSHTLRAVEINTSTIITDFYRLDPCTYLLKHLVFSMKSLSDWVLCQNSLAIFFGDPRPVRSLSAYIIENLLMTQFLLPTGTARRANVFKSLESDNEAT